MTVHTTTQIFDKIDFKVYGRFDECKSMLTVDLVEGANSLNVKYALGDSKYVTATAITSPGVYMIDRRKDMQIEVVGTVEYEVD